MLKAMVSIYFLFLSMHTASAQADGTAPKQQSIFLDKTRGYGQCEILIINRDSGILNAAVYNTIGLSECPPEQFDPIDLKRLSKETGSYMVWKNPRRFWVTDNLTIFLMGEPRNFDGLEFNYVANMQMPAGFEPSSGQSAFAYQPFKIRRMYKCEYLKGSQVYLLRSPDGHTWVMQTYTNHTDQNLTMLDLPKLAGKLTLAGGWQFKTKALDRDLIFDTKGIANVVPDDLENMYQGCIDGVNNFDPWD